MSVEILVLRWKLKEIMARYDITGVALAKEISVQEASISNLRNSKTIPSVGGQRLDQLCKALSKLAGKKIRFCDLYEDIDENEERDG